MELDFSRLPLDDSPDAVVAATAEGRVLDWSQGAERIFGYTRAEALGRLLPELIGPPDTSRAGAEAIRETLELGWSTYESLQRRKDGVLLYVDFSSKPVQTEDGRLAYILSTGKDVTHLRVRRDAKLVATRFRDLLESMPDGIILVNPTGRIVHANRQAEGLFGYAAGELQGRLVEGLMPKRYRGAHGGHRSGYFGQPRVRAMGMGLELYGLRKDGTEFPVEISLSPLQLEEGTLVISAVRDMTERHRFQRALREKNAELEAANGELAAFSYTISHDLRAPLRAIGGFARMAAEEYAAALPPAGLQRLRRIHDNAVKMGQLIDGLLAFSRLGRQALNKQTVQPTLLVRRALEDLQTDQTGRRLQLRVAELPPCQADPTLLGQVYANLLANALKYTRRRELAVIEVGARPANGGAVYFVKDNGAGFDPAYANKLFGVFQRLHRDDEFEGTGVGLAIAQRIIQRHGGRIWAEGAPDRGATFSFTVEPESRPDDPPLAAEGAGHAAALG